MAEPTAAPCRADCGSCTRWDCRPAILTAPMGRQNTGRKSHAEHYWKGGPGGGEGPHTPVIRSLRPTPADPYRDVQPRWTGPSLGPPYPPASDRLAKSLSSGQHRVKNNLNPTLIMFCANGICRPELASVVRFPAFGRHRLKSSARPANLVGSIRRGGSASVPQRVRTNKNPASFASFASCASGKTNPREPAASRPSRILRDLRHRARENEPRRTLRAQSSKKVLRHLRHLRHADRRQPVAVVRADDQRSRSHGLARSRRFAHPTRRSLKNPGQNQSLRNVLTDFLSDR